MWRNSFVHTLLKFAGGDPEPCPGCQAAQVESILPAESRWAALVLEPGKQHAHNVQSEQCERILNCILQNLAFRRQLSLLGLPIPMSTSRR